MRPGKEHRVFDRANWRRKARAPLWMRREETERVPAAVDSRKPLEV